MSKALVPRFDNSWCGHSLFFCTLSTSYRQQMTLTFTFCTLSIPYQQQMTPRAHFSNFTNICSPKPKTWVFKLHCLHMSICKSKSALPAENMQLLNCDSKATFIFQCKVRNAGGKNTLLEDTCGIRGSG